MLLPRVCPGRRARQSTHFTHFSSSRPLPLPLSLVCLPCRRCLGWWCVLATPALLQASSQRVFGMRAGRATAVLHVRKSACIARAFFVLASGRSPVCACGVWSRVEVLQYDNIFTRMRVRSIRPPMQTHTKGPGGSVTLLAKLRNVLARASPAERRRRPFKKASQRAATQHAVAQW